MDPLIDTELVRAWPLPGLDDDGDKHTRGQVLVVGGSVSVPGAAILTGLSALRAGAGKLKIMTTAPSAIPLGVAVPEALVTGLAPTADGGIDPEGAREIVDTASHVDVVVIGPGMTDAAAIAALLQGVLGGMTADGPVMVLDAGAVAALTPEIRLERLGGRVVLTPNERELAELLGADTDDIKRDTRPAAIKASEQFGAVVAVRGWVVSPEGQVWRHEGGTVGLGTSGSGDVKSGVIAGLIARGASPEQAAVWGMYAHGAAGELLSARIGLVGYLARELIDVIPEVLAL